MLRVSVAAAVVAVLMSAGAVLGGSGVGAIFNLGVDNSAPVITVLHGSPGTAILRVTNDAHGAALNLNTKYPGTAPISLDPESTGRVTYLNADMVDGKHASDFVGGKARLTSYAIALSPGGVSPVLWGGASDTDLYWSIGYVCPSTLTDNGSFRFLANPGNGNVNLFIDEGGADPEYISWPSGVELTRATSAPGEWVHIQVHSGLGWIANIDMFSVHRASDCHIQGMATTTLL